MGTDPLRDHSATGSEEAQFPTPRDVALAEAAIELVPALAQPRAASGALAGLAAYATQLESGGCQDGVAGCGEGDCGSVERSAIFHSRRIWVSWAGVLPRLRAKAANAGPAGSIPWPGLAIRSSASSTSPARAVDTCSRAASALSA